MSAYVVVDIDITDPVGYKEYRALAPASIAAHGGRFLARGGRTAVLEGEWEPQRVVILEFSSIEAAQAWLVSPEYAAALAIRRRTASANMIVVDGVS